MGIYCYDHLCNYIEKIEGFYKKGSKFENFFRSLIVIVLYGLIVILTILISTNNLEISLNWPFRQLDSDYSIYYENENDKKTINFISKDLFGSFITGLDNHSFWLGYLLTKYFFNNYGSLTYKKTKVAILIIFIFKDLYNLIKIITLIQSSCFEEGFANFIIFAIKTFYKEKLIATNINLIFKLLKLESIFLKEDDYFDNFDRIDFLIYYLKRYPTYIFLFYLTVSTLILSPYIIVGMIFIFPIFLLYYIFSMTLCNLIMLPLEFFFEFIFKYKKTKKEREYNSLDGMTRHYINKWNREEMEPIKEILNFLFLLKFLQNFISFSINFSILLFKGYNIFSIYYMFFSINFVSFNLFTIQFEKIDLFLQEWKTQYLTFI